MAGLDRSIRRSRHVGQTRPTAKSPIRLVEDAPRQRAAEAPLPLGEILVRQGALSPGDLARALALQARQDALLGEILVTQGMVSEAQLIRALSTQWRTEAIDPICDPPDPRLVDRLGAATCLQLGLLPWRRAGGVTVIATARPEDFARQIDRMEALFGPVAQALCAETHLRLTIERMRAPALVQAAETRVAAPFHCRGLGSGWVQRLVLASLLGLAALLMAAPVPVLTALTVWAVVTLLMTACLRVAALWIALSDQFRQGRRQALAPQPAPKVALARLPVISVLVPLFEEEDITGRLLRRLQALSYPRELTDICLVVEAGDDRTRRVLMRTDLPRWIRVVTVPTGAVRTKPRALNYALEFCRGSIVGVWDAEDAPAPDQLHKVARRFHSAPQDVACLQGRLDFYNARTNWLSRCFALEYAAWFRVILPGMVRMGFAIPLGGTTLFFRRAALVEVGGWDAHNVTEDADLGIRLARLGYRSEMVETTTREEANARLLPWIRQRSRWLKGYTVTYAVHMRNPVRLWRDLGAWRFMGVQLVFLCTLSQFLLAPLLWSFWLLAFGLPHFLPMGTSGATLAVLAGLFVLSELITLTTAAVAIRGMNRRWLLAWVPTLHVYFPLGALAAYKGLAELAFRPFYWDKTPHGVFEETCPDPESGQNQPL